METKTTETIGDSFDELPAELAELFRNSSPVSQDAIDALAATNRALSDDADFMADLLKGYFVERVLEGLCDTNLNKSQLGKKIGKSRQYVNKILDEDKRVNFTIDTMAKIAHAIDCRLDIHVLKKNEEAQIFRTLDHREVRPVSQVVDFTGSRTITPTFTDKNLQAV